MEKFGFVSRLRHEAQTLSGLTKLNQTLPDPQSRKPGFVLFQERVHSNTRAPRGDGPGLLADDVGTEREHDCHVDAGRGVWTTWTVKVS